MDKTSITPVLQFPQKGGKMAELIRQYDWASSVLGEPETWPESLRISVLNMLGIGLPMFVLWGENMICIHNDAALSGMDTEGGTLPAIGKRAPEIWSESWDILHPLIKKVWNTGEPVTLNELHVPCFRNNNLEDTFWNLSCGLIEDDNGKAGGILVVCQDASYAVLERIRLKKSESQLLSVIAHAPAAIAVFTGKELIIEHPNEFFIELFDKGEEIAGKSMYSLLSGWVKNDQQFLNLIKDVFESGKAYEAKEVEVFFKKENETRYFNISFIPLTDSSNTVYAILDVSLNVTDQVLARKKLESSETHLELLSNTVPAMIFYLDSQQRYLTYNETFQQWFKIGSQEALGKTVNDFIGDQAYSIVEPHLKKAFGGEQVLYEMMAPGRFKDNKWLSIVYTPHKDESGNVLGIIVHATDITKSKETEMSLQSKNQELILVNNDLDNFIYTASHDLKAPISNLEGLLTAFQDTSTLNEDQQMLMEMMATSIGRFKATINDLTEISKSQYNNQEEIVSFQSLLDEILLDIGELTERFSPLLNIQFSIKEISFSRKNLRSILYNLLSNSLKYSFPGRTPVILISTELEDNFLVLKVTDNGLGLSEANQNKIFGMFQRVHHHIEGSGIGLYMIKKMAENVGGRINLTSEEGKGTTFTIFLPYKG